MDYAFQLNKLMYERLLEGGNITFFDPNDVPGLYESFYSDQEQFKELYEKYEKDPKIKLIKKFNLSSIQCDAILDMKLRNLKKIEEKDIKNEYKRLTNEKADLQNLLKSKAKQKLENSLEY